MNVDQFLNSTPSFNLSTFDFFDHAECAQLQSDMGADCPSLDVLRGRQRLMRLECQGPAAQSLEEAGLTSACSIAAMSESRFVEVFSEVFPGGTTQAEDIHRRARTRKMAIVNLALTVRQLVASPHSRALASDNLTLEIQERFESIPSYQDLFGSLNYCQCEQCKSIYSPSAYVLDVMRLIDTYITEVNEIPTEYLLETRRPDLFTMKLDCKNTNDVQPVLQLIDNILAQLIEQTESIENAYELLAVALFPFQLPFNLPLAQVRAYLKPMRTSLADIYRVFLVPPSGSSVVAPISIARESLGLSIEEYQIVTTSEPDPKDLAAFYGLADPSELSGLAVVSEFLNRTSLTRDQLVALFTQNLSDAEWKSDLADSFFINATGEELPPLQIVIDETDPMNPYEKIDNLSDRRLDRLNRFIRLSTPVQLDYANLDWSMKAAQQTEITSDFINKLAYLNSLASSSSLSPENIASFWFDVKDIGKGKLPYPDDLFDRVFNHPALLSGRDPYTSPSPIPFDPNRPLNWDLTSDNGKNPEIRSRLSAAIQVSSDDLTVIGRYLVGLLGWQETQIELNLTNLSWFYRIAKQSQWLKLRLDAYFQLAGLIFYPKSPYLSPPENGYEARPSSIAQLKQATDWLQSAPFTVYELRYIISGTVTETVFPGYVSDQVGPFIDDLANASVGSRLGAEGLVSAEITPDQSESLLASLKSGGWITPIGIRLPKPADFQAMSTLFQITSTSFHIPDGLITEKESEEAFAQLVENNVIVVENPVDKKGLLSPNYTPQTPLGYLFPDDSSKRQQVRQLLDQTSSNIGNTVAVLAEFLAIQDQAANRGLGEFLSTTPEMMALLVPFAAGVADLRDVLAALLTPLDGQPVPTEVLVLIDLLARANMLFAKLKMSLIQVEAVVRGPQFFNIDDTTELRLENVVSLTEYMRLVADFQDVNQVLIRCYFGIIPIGECHGSKLEILSNLTGWPQSQIERLIALFWPNPLAIAPYETVAGLVAMQRVFTMGTQTSMDVSSLINLAQLSDLNVRKSDGTLNQKNWDTFSDVAQATLSALSTRLGEEAFTEAFRDLQGILLEKQRKALVGSSIWILNAKAALRWIKKPSDLYQYLLVDVETSGCDDTSPIVLGIASLQLYLQRVRMNMEPGITRIPIPDTWWDWILTYRIWEANRKIFLYPENYVDPDLRQKASPIFAGFSEDLLQNEIDDTHATQAYNGYFNQLSEVATLVQNASLRAIVSDRTTGESLETLFIFGRTRIEPYSFYYRSLMSGVTWTPWQRIDLSLKAAFISPAYAFGRLFIFWSEQTTNKSSGISQSASSPQSTNNDALMYSFLDATGTWIQPQTLVGNYVVNAHPPNYDAMKDAYIASLYEPEQLPWREPHIFGVSRGLPGTGRISFVADFNVVSGADTLFDRQIKVGDTIRCAAQERTVISISKGGKQLVVNDDWTLGATLAEFEIIPADPAGTTFPTFIGAGTISFVDGFNTVQGSADSQFPLELSIGDKVTAQGETRTVLLINQALKSLVVDRDWGVSGTDVPYSVVPQALGAERLLILLGSGLDSTRRVKPGTSPVVEPNPGRDQFIAERNDFDSDLFRTLVLADKVDNFIIPGGTKKVSADVTCGVGMTLGESLEQTTGRFLVLDWQYYETPVDSLQPYRADIDRNNGLLNVVKSENTLADNYWGNSQPTTERSVTPPTGESRPILYNVPSLQAWIANVSNQTGWFVFGTGDESFLVQTTQAGIKPLSDLIVVRPYPTSAGALNELVISSGPISASPMAFSDLQFRFTRLSTSVVDRLGTRLLAFGLEGLLSLSSQVLPELPFDRFYDDATGTPAPTIDTQNLPSQLLDFNGSFGLYFWEIFFFNVFLVANRLNQNQRFEESKAWYEFIFDPMRLPSPQDTNPNDRFWQFLPFRNLTPQSLQQILTNQEQIAAYNDDPFSPDAIARLRPGAYPKAIVMRYIDNLIDWGDQLFAQDTRESITQATNLYVMANDLLGPRPQMLGTCETPSPKSYRDIKNAYDTTGTAVSGTSNSITLDADASDETGFYNGLLIDITSGPGNGQQRTVKEYDGSTRVATVTRDWEPQPNAGSVYQIRGIPQFYIDLENGAHYLNAVEYSDIPFNDLDIYFCVPENAELMAYWDRIEDRLFKIRHCMNIEGVVRSLALFSPPIDPRALIRAAASGNLGPTGSLLSDPAIPNYRFEVMIERARNFTSTVIQLGSSLLAALEKQDAEALALLQNSQESAILALTTQIKEDQIEEVQATGQGLVESKNGAQARYDFYTKAIQDGLSSGEQANLDAMAAALAFNILASIGKTASAIAYTIPQVGSPFAMTYGGIQIGSSLAAAAEVFEIGSLISNYVSQRSLTVAGYDRRASDWELQQTLASQDVLQIERQIQANQIRLQIAQRELAVQLQQIDDNQVIGAFLKSKFTDKELYQWMVTRLSTAYFKAYELAFDLARSAQRAYQYQIGTNKTFIEYGYWDNLKKGLTSGESLMLALNQLDNAYLQKNSRPLEIERSIALSQIDAKALLDLKSSGECLFSFTEKMFDDDFPGQYLRRIQSLSLSLPAVLGPYQNIKAILTQLGNQVVLQPNIDAVSFLLGGTTDGELDPDVLRSNWWPNQQVALSKGVNDSGLFELNFSDSRYLPFENTGAVSTWRLSMPPQTNRFNFDSITDVIFTLRYTALDGGSKFRSEVVRLPELTSTQGAALITFPQQYPQDWFAFTQDHSDPVTQSLRFQLNPTLLPQHVSDILLNGFYFKLDLADGVSVAAGSQFISFVVSDKVTQAITLSARADFTHNFTPGIEIGDIFKDSRTVIFDLTKTPAALKKDGFIDPDKVIGIGLILDYGGTIRWT